jgi:uncharacterized protein (TIGR02996 family)
MAPQFNFLNEYTDEMHTFVLAICANVRDQLQQLIFADWLDEHGHDVLSEAMRHHDLIVHLTPSMLGYSPDGSPKLPHYCSPTQFLFAMYRAVNLLHENDPGDTTITVINFFHPRLTRYRSCGPGDPVRRRLHDWQLIDGDPAS